LISDQFLDEVIQIKTVVRFGHVHIGSTNT